MYMAILSRFMKASIVAAVFLVAFSLAFYMVFHEPDLKVNMYYKRHYFHLCLCVFAQGTPFDSPEITIVETISQALGSPDFSIFRLVNDGTQHNQVPYLALFVIIWIVFGVFISVLFITFLVRNYYCRMF